MGLVDGVLAKEGFYLYREWFPWGKTDAYRDGKGNFRFAVGGKIMFPAELYAYLVDTWVPQSVQDLTFKMDALKGYFSVFAG